WRKQDRHRADRAVIGIARGHWSDVGDLSRVAVVARDAAAGTAVNEVRVQRIDRGAAVFLDADRMPVVRGQLTIVAARRHARRTRVLLPAANPIRPGVVDADLVHRGGRLVVPTAPRLAAVDGDDRTLVAVDRQDLGVVRIDPGLLVIVAARRAAESGPRLAAIDGFPQHRRVAVNDVGIFRIDRELRQIAAADPRGRTWVLRHPVPARTGIVGTVK